jgi:hypothetical protein
LLPPDSSVNIQHKVIRLFESPIAAVLSFLENEKTAVIALNDSSPKN